MSTPIEPISGSSPASQEPSEEEAKIPQHTKHELQKSADELQSAIQQIQASKDTNEPIPQDALHKVEQVSHKVQSLISEVNSVEAQNSLNDAVQQIQIVTQNPQAQLDPAGQLTNAYMTITETIQSS